MKSKKFKILDYGTSEYFVMSFSDVVAMRTRKCMTVLTFKDGTIHTVKKTDLLDKLGGYTK